MSDAKCARMLLEAAKRDIEALRVMRQTGGLPDEIYGFHVQQAAEKLLKAWIALLGESYPLTHSIETLLKLLADRGVDTAPFLDLSAYTPLCGRVPLRRRRTRRQSRSIALARLRRSKRYWSRSRSNCLKVGES